MNSIFTSIRRTPYQSMASFLILFFTLFLSLFFFSLISFFHGILGYVETKPQVTIYFQTETREADISRIKRDIENTGKVASATYMSKESALEIYQDLNRDNPLLLEMVSADILPPSLEVYTTRPEYLQDIATFASGQNIVDEVVFQRDVVDKIVSVTNTMRLISISILVVLILVSFMVLMTTSAFKIALKKEEIQLLRLIGASRFYVRAPFLNEGVFFGFVSGTAAFSIFYGVFFYFRSFFDSYLLGISELPFFGLEAYNLYVWPPTAEYIGLSYLMTITFGISIAYVGTFLATSKYIGD